MEEPFTLNLDMLPAIKKALSSAKGFTLIELIVVIGMLTILFAIVLVAVNPGRQFGSSRNTARQNDVRSILNAVAQYSADNNGNLPALVDLTVRTIQSGAGAGIADLCATLSPRYISALPTDPTAGSPTPGVGVTNCAAAYNTGYTITRDANNRVTVAATTTDLGATISVTR